VAARRAELAATGTPVAFVHAVSDEEATPWFEKAGLADLPRISDPDRRHYEAFGLGRARLSSLLAPALLTRGAVCALRYGAGPQPAHLRAQMPGVFLVQGDRILRASRHRQASDRPDYVGLARTGPPDPLAVTKR
jgi:hypothetical protein